MSNFFGNIKRTCSTSGQWVTNGNEWGMSTGQSCLSSADCPTYLYQDVMAECGGDIVICNNLDVCDEYCEDRMSCIDGCCSCLEDTIWAGLYPDWQSVCAPIYGGMDGNRRR